jgi:MinD-like ATPase involved in chromosome partitioning or flagellar assembly
MTVIALGSVRSCGLTTLAVALTATWPAERQVLLCECDPAGGTLAAAAGWPSEPSTVSLAAAARRESDPEVVWSHTHDLPGGAPVLAGPALPEQASGAIAMLDALLGRLGELSADVVIDCGRLTAGFPRSITENSDQLVLAARPALADLHGVAAWCEAYSDQREGLALVLIGEGPYSNAEVTEALGLPVLARLPWDPGAAARLVSMPVTDRELNRSPLIRSARTLAGHLCGARSDTDPGEVPSLAATARQRRFRSGRTTKSDVSAQALLTELCP